MTVIITAALFLVVLCGVARGANARLRREARLPMQWWINGDVTWSAPRAFALAFIPALALAVFASLLVLPPRPGQEGDVLPVTVGTGVTFIAVQFLHFWMIEKTLKRGVR